MHRYKELDVWKKAIELTKVVYRLCQQFPEDEKFGLVSQLKRATVSVASNIAEGAGRNSDKEFNQFLGISIGSLHEVETQMIIACELEFISKEQLNDLSEKITSLIKMTISLKKKLS